MIICRTPSAARQEGGDPTLAVPFVVSSARRCPTAAPTAVLPPLGTLRPLSIDGQLSQQRGVHLPLGLGHEVWLEHLALLLYGHLHRELLGVLGVSRADLVPPLRVRLQPVLDLRFPGLGQLWLLDSANNPARIILKHRRCVDTGRWRQREIGPYADHSRCRAAGSHIALDGSKLCGECMCFAAKKKRRVVKAEPAVAALAMPVMP